ncbi:GNAT family N-acetyltransferase [Candidatus Gottesmanbacteria bacterium]|nr:GNAT family N-acetyltransferase [Candidatus Gottesmanbacteria bacterium]
MFILSATLEDLPVILALNHKLFTYEQTYTNTYSLDWTYSDIGKAYFSGRIMEKNGICLIAHKKNKIIGYACGYTYFFSARNPSQLAELENIYVEEAYRSRGVGSQLVNAFEARARRKGAKILKIRALIKNTQAHAFYKHTGFNEAGVIFEKLL